MKLTLQMFEDLLCDLRRGADRERAAAGWERLLPALRRFNAQMKPETETAKSPLSGPPEREAEEHQRAGEQSKSKPASAVYTTPPEVSVLPASALFEAKSTLVQAPKTPEPETGEPDDFIPPSSDADDERDPTRRRK